MQHISACQPLCAHKNPYSHNRSDFRDLSTTAEIRIIFQLWFYDMCAAPDLFSLKADFIIMEIRTYLQKFSFNILEL